MTFKNIEALGLRVEWRPILNYNVVNAVQVPTVDANDLEALLEKGVRVYGRKSPTPNNWQFADFQNHCADYRDTHSGLLIGIQPIVKPDTAEGLLREFIATAHIHAFDDSEWGRIAERARKLLGDLGEK